MSRSSASISCLFVTWLACLLAALPARANGRFPASQYVVVGPAAGDGAIVVRATLGLFVSRDQGRSFAWICEESVGYGGSWDPPLALARDGAVVVGMTDGLSVGDDCAFVRPVGGSDRAIVDLAHDPSGTRIVAVEGEASGRSRLFLSEDGGRRFEAPPGAAIDGAFTTVDFAPSDARVLYAAARSPRGAPALYRSDDGGRTLTMVTADFLGAEDVYLAAVDPRDAQVLWARATRGTETWLLRSRDGGQRWERLYVMPEPMLGFALADDGARVWIGGESQGLWASSDGRSFTRMSDAPVRCLRHHAGALYVCTDHTRGGNALARWRDGARSPEPLLFFRDVEAAPDCPVQSPVLQRCAPAWRAQREAILTATRDAGMDAQTAVDVAMISPDARVDASTSRRAGSSGDDCGCHARRSVRPSAWALWLALAAAVRGVRGRRPSTS